MSKVVESFLNSKGYEIKSTIGQGSFSHCYLIYSLKYKTNFVCKIIKTDPHATTNKFSETYYAEIDALVHLDHPHIIKIYDHWKINDQMIIILEYCQNGNLSKRIANGAPFTEAQLINYTRQLIDILVYCHSNLLAHHDIKPANIFIDRYGRLKLGDFGLSHFGGISSQAIGSLAYMAPEMFNKAPYDAYKADIWAFGVTLFQMATNTLPFKANSCEMFIKILKEGKYLIPPSVPPIISAVIKQCLITNPEERWTILEIDSFFKKASETMHVNLPRIEGKYKLRKIHPSISGLSLNQIIKQNQRFKISGMPSQRPVSIFY